MNNSYLFTILTIGWLVVGASAQAQDSATVRDSKAHQFVPPAGKQLLFIGQDNGSVGGFGEPNNNGYYENVKQEIGGVTTYASMPNLDGLYSHANWGSGDLDAQAIVDNDKFDNSAIAIGLWMVNQLKSINEGRYDNQIERLGRWIKDADRPVYLRIGYEFDGMWNHYNPEHYKKAFIRFCDILDSLEVKNYVTVWQSCASPVDDKLEGFHENIEDWYPGDQYVDVVGYSWFLSDFPKQIELTDELLAFARAHNKPVMCAESASQGYDIKRLTRREFGNMFGSMPGENKKKKKPEEIWQDWFVPYFDYIEKNKDVIRIVAYINCNWDVQDLWDAPYEEGYWGDTRVEANDYIKAMWLEEISKAKWLHSSPDLFEQLGYTRQSEAAK